MARITSEELLTFVRLDYSIVQPDEVESAIEFAADEVEFHSPLDEEQPRSVRAEPLRKRAELNLAAAQVWRRIATDQGLSRPAKQILQTLNISLGTDFPTPTDYVSAFNRIADVYQTEGTRILRTIQPITATIMAGENIDDD